MQLSAAGRDLIASSEGFRSQIYLDIAGFPSIGYGHRLLPHESFPTGITLAQAAEILAVDAQKAERAVEELVKVLLTQNQFDALVDFCFNLGAGRLAASALLKELNAGRYEEARQQLLSWDFAAGEISPGLKNRREAEYAFWSSPPTSQQAAA